MSHPASPTDSVSPSNPDGSAADPVFASGRRELVWILASWVGCFLWVIGYCGLFGYRTADQPLVTVLGMPSWVFWGIVLPWILTSMTSIWFALRKIEDHPFEDADSDSPRERDDG